MCPEGARDVGVADLLKGAADAGYRQGVLQQSGQVSQPATVGGASQLPCTPVAASITPLAKLVCAHLSLGAPEAARPAGQQY